MMVMPGTVEKKVVAAEASATDAWTALPAVAAAAEVAAVMVNSILTLPAVTSTPTLLFSTLALAATVPASESLMAGV